MVFFKVSLSCRPYEGSMDERLEQCDNCRSTQNRTTRGIQVGRNGISGTICMVGLFIVLSLQFVESFAFNKGGDIKVEVKVPREAEVGSSVDLRCEWRLYGGNSLYSVKWYKDDHEFFRYVPDNRPAIQTFQQPGVFLNKERNNENSIRLQNLSLKTSGQYKCEVSTEAPSFATYYQTANLTVISLPEREPEITGLSSHYAVGENVTANCTAWPSVPKANLRWTINNEPVAAENTVQHPPMQPISSLGIPNSLGLLLEAESRHFQGGEGLVRIKCIAEVGSQKFETEKRVLMAYVNNQRLSAGDMLRGSANNLGAIFFGPLLVFILNMVAT
ncbi:uncharacterized protein [Prorops nasuta]|uniref:uncharacterized protein n=1 Tax=Prorops nasuta TaxID=863751 RepID=UPI0034CD3214